jgi:Na+-transporting methylmalonyl-CoA/oxaloacetate decarboxylase gamma subunit
MESDLLLGLRISLLGLSITFVAMGLVILVMVLLLRIFPVRSVAVEEAVPADLPAAEAADEQALEEMAVALAVGICLLERDGALRSKDPSLGKLLEE